MSQTTNEQRLARISKDYENRIEEGLIQAMTAAKTLGSIEAENNGRTHFADDATLLHLAQLQAKLDKAVVAMTLFCDRVDNGEVKSTRTYSQFKTLLAELNYESKKDGQ